MLKLLVKHKKPCNDKLRAMHEYSDIQCLLANAHDKGLWYREHCKRMLVLLSKKVFLPIGFLLLLLWYLFCCPCFVSSAFSFTFRLLPICIAPQPWCNIKIQLMKMTGSQPYQCKLPLLPMLSTVFINCTMVK